MIVIFNNEAKIRPTEPYFAYLSYKARILSIIYTTD